MDLQNNQNSQPDQAKKALQNDQMNSATSFLTSPTKPTIDDMELNEEQLDIISGGGDSSNSSNPFSKG